MSFSKKCKKLKLIFLKNDSVSMKNISAQYNPDRFKYYKRTCSDAKQMLGIHSMPHVSLLQAYQDQGDSVLENLRTTNYYKMQKMYGRDKRWIIRKVKAFISLFNYIKAGKPCDLIEVINKPVVQNNKYSNQYEIWEGHHRIACCYVLGHKDIMCKVYKISRD